MSLIPTLHHGTPFKRLKKVYIDFEYNGTTQAKFNLVCCSFVFGKSVRWPESYWLHYDPKNSRALKEDLLNMRETHIFVAYNVTAEASAFISLGLDPTKFAWIDLHLEYKMLTNHWDKYRYGEQLMKGKKIRTYPPKPKWDMTEEEKKNRKSAKPETNLAACTFKMTGAVRDTEHKTAMRDLIISSPDDFTLDEKFAITEYCDEDVIHLPGIWEKISRAYSSSTAKLVIVYSQIALRGAASARSALMAQTGYPVSKKSVTKFSKSVNKILNEIAEDINRQFPEMKVFVWNKAENRFSKKEKPQQDWIATCEYADNWMLTEGGKYSLSLDAYSAHFSFRHDFPEKVFPAQMLRYLKVKQSLNGFIPSKKKKTFFDSYGEDGRARAWLNPYGSQSSRFQPGATGFIPLKSAWMRSLIQPGVGNAIVGIDYGSEEFLISALVSGDEKMYESYASGDPYFDFAKLAKAVDKNAVRKDHESIRLRFKSTVLGVSYLMGAVNLAKKLTEDTGEVHVEADAQKLIDAYFSVYKKYAKWIEDTIYDYKKRSYLQLPDGWIMFGDNRNHRSVSNCPIQGFGACILRKAIELAQCRGLKVIIPLHDALYVEYNIAKNPHTPDILRGCMKEAFSHYFKDDEEKYIWSQAIRLDMDVWGPGLEEGYFKTELGHDYKQQEIYIDPRAVTEYRRFQKYL